MPAYLPDGRDALWWMAQDLAAVFGTAEEALIREMASALRPYLDEGKDITAARLTEARQAAARIAEQVREQTTEQVPAIMATAAQHGANTALSEVAAAAALPPIQMVGPIGAAAVTALAADLTNALDVVTQRILRWPDDVFRRVVGQTSTNVLLGLDTGRQAQARAWQGLLAEGVTFVDKAGRRWNTATYVEMATRTATRRAWEAQHTATMAEHGIDLVTVVIGSRACEKCAAWDGKILRTDHGPTGDVIVDRADGNGTMTVRIAGTLDQAKEHGLSHPNCRCRPVAYLPGISKVEKNTSFDPEGHANEQELRRLERGVRKAKMEEAAALTPEQKKAAAAKVRAGQAAIREHVEATGVPRRREREQLNYGHKVQVDGKQAQPVNGLPSMGRPAIPEITPEDREHILSGHPTKLASGGHRAGTGRPGKTEFPADWSDDKIIDAVRTVQNSPTSARSQKRGQRFFEEEIGGVTIRVAERIREDGTWVFATAYPVRGAGVVHNPRRNG